jgi:hypothetical protein
MNRTELERILQVSGGHSSAQSVRDSSQRESQGSAIAHPCAEADGGSGFYLAG